MKTVIVSKAKGGTEPHESAVIDISGAIPDIPLDEDYPAKHREFFEEQGKVIADALFGHLPGGTVDQLICEMLQRRASLFRVPF